MSTTINLSIIVPVYSPPPLLLVKCIESLHQICKNNCDSIEILLIDNNGPLAIKQILKKYSKVKWFRIISLSKNLGFSGACNIGLENAIGRYLHFCDSDDMIINDSLNKVLECLNHKTVDVALFGYRTFDCEKNEYNSYFPSNFLKDNDGKIISLGEDYQQIFHEPMCVWNKLFRREFLDSKNIKFNTLFSVAAPDVFFSNQALCLAERIYILNTDVYVYSINVKNSVMDKLKSNKNDLYPQVSLFCRELEKFACENVHKDLHKYQLRLILEVIKLNLGMSKGFTAYKTYNCFRRTLKNLSKNFAQNINSLDRGLQHFYKEVINSNYFMFNLRRAFLFNSGEQTVSFFGIKLFNKKRVSYESEIYIEGILRKDYYKNKVKYYILGIPIFKKIRKH